MSYQFRGPGGGPPPSDRGYLNGVGGMAGLPARHNTVNTYMRSNHSANDVSSMISSVPGSPLRGPTSPVLTPASPLNGTLHPVGGPMVGGFAGPTVGGFGPYGESVLDQRRLSAEYIRRSHSRADSHTRAMSPAPGYYAARRLSRQ
ncbi:hypothetical protein HK097_006128, partial [Rhizophlyctis rosea]